MLVQGPQHIATYLTRTNRARSAVACHHLQQQLFSDHACYADVVSVLAAVVGLCGTVVMKCHEMSNKTEVIPNRSAIVADCSTIEGGADSAAAEQA